MTPAIIKICKPARVPQSCIVTNVAESSCLLSVTLCNLNAVWYGEKHISSVPSCSEPQPIGFYQRKNFLICNRIHVGDNDDSFVVIKKLLNIFAKQTERRISYHNVRLFQ